MRLQMLDLGVARLSPLIRGLLRPDNDADFFKRLSAQRFHVTNVGYQGSGDSLSDRATGGLCGLAVILPDWSRDDQAGFEVAYSAVFDAPLLGLGLRLGQQCLVLFSGQQQSAGPFSQATFGNDWTDSATCLGRWRRHVGGARVPLATRLCGYCVTYQLEKRDNFSARVAVQFRRGYQRLQYRVDAEGKAHLSDGPLRSPMWSVAKTDDVGMTGCGSEQRMKLFSGTPGGFEPVAPVDLSVKRIAPCGVLSVQVPQTLGPCERWRRPVRTCSRLKSRSQR